MVTLACGARRLILLGSKLFELTVSAALRVSSPSAGTLSDRVKRGTLAWELSPGWKVTGTATNSM